jgi:hypothetical protein
LFLLFFFTLCLPHNPIPCLPTDIHEYLPKDTLDWCKAQLASYDIDLDLLSAADIDPEREEGNRLHTRAYTLLQSVIRTHIRTGALPLLSTCPKLDGGYDRVERYRGSLQEIIEDNADFARRGREIDQELADEQGQFEDDDLVDEVMADD